MGGKRYRGTTDDELSPIGWQQMNAAFNPHEHWDRILTSPLTRCKAFSLELGHQRQIDVSENPAWQEMNFGLWEAATSEQLWQTSRKQFGRFLSDPTKVTPPQGESIHELRDRVELAWQSVLSGPSQKILLVTHGGPIRIILHLILGVPLASIMKIDVPFACVTRFEVLFRGQDTPYVRLKSHAGRGTI